MAIPERYHLDALRKLRGDAYVTFPSSDLSVRRVERVYSVPRARAASPDAFLSPQTIEYTDTKLVEQHFTGGDQIYVEVYQAWETLPGSELVTKSIGAINLIPEKYRRLVRTTETNQPVAADYVFPSGLTGDETQISLIQDNLAKARLKVIEEIIDTDEDPLQGAKTDEFGVVQIYESIVVDGTQPDVGELIQSSEVTPLGNGKSIKITVQYPDDLFSLQKVTRSIGQENLIPEKYRRLVKHVETESPVPVDYTFPTGLTGDEAKIEFIQQTVTQARLRILEEVIDTDESELDGAETDLYGTLTIHESIVIDGTAADEGFYIKKSTVTPLGNGKSIKISVEYDGFVTLTSVDIDPDTNIKITRVRSIVDPATDGGVVGNVITEIKEIDKWRSLKIVSTVNTDSLPAPVSLNVTEHWSFPDNLIGLTILPSKGRGFGVLDISGNSWSWDGEVSAQIINGYRGPCVGTLERSYSIGAPSYVPQITPILPSTGTVVFNAGSWSDLGGSTITSTSRSRAVTIPNVLTRGIKERKTLVNFPLTARARAFITFAGGIEDFGGAYDINIPASTPVQLTNGQEFTARVTVTKYRGAGNVYILEVLKLKAVVGQSYLNTTQHLTTDPFLRLLG